MFLWAAPAFGYSLSVLGVPEIGGGMAHPTEAGALGVVYNPAAAWSEHREVLLDAALFTSHYTFQLDGQEAVVSDGLSAVPSMAVAIPVGPVGLGAAVFAPYARGGDPYEDDGPQRYYTIEGSLLAFEGDFAASIHLPALGRRPLVAIDLGAGVKLVSLTQSSRRAYDTGALLYNLLGPEAGVPLQDPFLEGTQQVGEGSDLGLGWTMGLRASLAADTDGEPLVTATVDYRSGTRHDLPAKFALTPSNDLTMALEGDVVTHLALPPAADGGLRVALGHHDDPVHGAILAEVGWIGWSSVAHIESELSNLAITSPDPLMTSVLKGYGVTEASFLAALDGVTTTTAAHDSFSTGIAGDVLLPRGWGARVGVTYAAPAIPDSNVHPGNCDFSTWNLRASGSWEVSRLLWLAVSGGVYLAPTRVVTSSDLALTNAMETGMVYPPGNGTYALTAARLGLTARVRL